MGNGSGSSALDPEIKRDLLELNLIEEYGWTPAYIATLPYKWIQKHMYIKQMKAVAIDQKQAIQKFKNQGGGLKPGQRTTREV